MTDPRELIFSGIAGTTVTAAVIAGEPGIVTNTGAAAAAATELGLTIEHCPGDGETLAPGGGAPHDRHAAPGGPALGAVAAQPALAGHRTVIQIESGDLAGEACAAARAAARIVFIDTGQMSDITAVSAGLREHGLRDRVQLAFGGGVRLEDIDRLRELDVDIVDVGRAIVDAPLLDMSVRVIAVSGDTADWSLLEKTELRIEHIGLDRANLTDVAATVADQLAIPRDQVLVIDARDDLLALDIHRQRLREHA